MATQTEQILAFLERIHDQVLAAAMDLLEVEPADEFEDGEGIDFAALFGGDEEEEEDEVLNRLADEALEEDQEPERPEIPVTVGRDDQGRLVAEGPGWTIMQTGGTIVDLLQAIIEQVLKTQEDLEAEDEFLERSEDEAALDDVWED